MERSGHFDASATLPPGRKTQVSMHRVPEPAWTLWTRKTFSVPAFFPVFEPTV